MNIKGLALCKAYFNDIAHASMSATFPAIMDDIAVGLIGAGSDCFGYDDAISRDHDWGPGFGVFIPDALFSAVADSISAWYDTLPKTFMGYGPRRITETGRIGPIHLENFFAAHTGFKSKTPSLKKWLYANSAGLALVTNGEVFLDNSGVLTSWRNALTTFPEDVRKKKIASDCFLAGQSGQYNHIRSVKRADAFAAEFALTQFCSRALSIAFLLAKRYAPYYKWKLRAAKDLPAPYADIALGVDDILYNRDVHTQDRIEALSANIIAHIKAQGLASGSSDFLADYKNLVEATITDTEIKGFSGLY